MANAIIELVCLAGVLAIAGVATYRAISARIHQDKCMSYVRRAEDGTLYAIDPQTKEMHKLEIGIDGHVRLAERFREVSPRQRKRIRQGIRRAIEGALNA